MVKVIKNMHLSQNKQSGVASIFIVVFFTLLISIIVISFVTIVSQDQRQSINSDLSNSAYDSAQAGVEDAKRGLEQYRINCLKDSTPASDCASKYTSTDPAAPGALSGEECTTFQDKLNSDLSLDVDAASKEVRITTDTANDSDLDQAYTCLKVKLETSDYKRSLQNSNSIIVPLKGVTGNPSTIQLNWFEKSEWYVKDTGNALDLPNVVSGGSFALPKGASDWGARKPPIMRVQVIAVPTANISIDEIDNNSRAVFLYPSSAGGNTVSLGSVDTPPRGSVKESPVAVRCVDTATYACTANITDFSLGGGYEYYLRLMPTYNNAKLQIKMLDSAGGVIKFDGVEPEIDSTGRANDVFRRAITRVAFDSDQSGIDVTQGICKNFRLADGTQYYSFDCAGRNELVNE